MVNFFRERSGPQTLKRERGASLERLLDSGADKAHPLPLNRTGMRSALQIWYNEKNKLDLTSNILTNSGDGNNNLYSNHAKYEHTRSHSDKDLHLKDSR